MNKCVFRLTGISLIALSLCFPIAVFAQDVAEKPALHSEIDPSKPSNLYSSLEISGEWQQMAGKTNVWGTRLTGSYAPSEKHLLQVEIPVLYQPASKSGGIGDIRARYFGLVRKDDTKKVNAFGGSLDVFLPTGSLNNGLGSGSWIVAPGIIAGITLSPRMLIYPIVSFVHITKPDLEGSKALNGGSIEVLSVLDLGSASWLQFSPKYSLNDFANSCNTSLNFRLSLGKMLREDISMAGEVFYEAQNKLGLQNSAQLSFAKYF